MSTRAILEDGVTIAGWNSESMIALLCEYIDNQRDDAGFAAFVADAVAREQEEDDELLAVALTREEISNLVGLLEFCRSTDETEALYVSARTIAKFRSKMIPNKETR